MWLILRVDRARRSEKRATPAEVSELAELQRQVAAKARADAIPSVRVGGGGRQISVV